MSSKLLMAAVLVVAGVACGTKTKSNEYPPEFHAPIPLNAPTDIVGSWKQCKEKSGAIHSFNADGTYTMTPVQYKNDDCSDEGTALKPFSGHYVAGTKNELDISLKSSATTEDTLYRVFSVQGNVLLISNNVNAGASADSRDAHLDGDVLSLTRVAN